jgi:hypothetical protein
VILQAEACGDRPPTRARARRHGDFPLH